MAEKLSKKLNETLSEKDRSAVESLFNVSDKLEQFFSYAECSGEERETIADKELNIMYLVEQIVKIKDMHISNAEKKDRIHAIIKDVDVDYLLEEVKSEMAKVQKHMVDRAKEISLDLQKEFGTVERSFNSLIDSNIETEEEKGKDAEERKKKILEDEKEKSETSLVKYEGKGFWANFKKIREQGKEDPSKKKNIFKALAEAYRTTVEESRPQVEEEPKDAEVEKLEKEMQALDEQIKASKENTKKLQDQKKEVKRHLLEANVRAMEEAKAKIEESKEPIPAEEITEDRVGGMFERIAAYRHNKKIEKLKGKINDLTQDIKGMSDEIKDRREKLEKDGENKEYEKDIAFDVKHITKNQIQRDKLAREVHREEVLHASKQAVRESRERHRNEGMDR